MKVKFCFPFTFQFSAFSYSAGTIVGRHCQPWTRDTLGDVVSGRSGYVPACPYSRVPSGRPQAQRPRPETEGTSSDSPPKILTTHSDTYFCARHLLFAQFGIASVHVHLSLLHCCHPSSGQNLKRMGVLPQFFQVLVGSPAFSGAKAWSLPPRRRNAGFRGRGVGSNTLVFCALVASFSGPRR